jgi:hypothetical protein
VSHFRFVFYNEDSHTLYRGESVVWPV